MTENGQRCRLIETLLDQLNMLLLLLSYYYFTEYHG